MSEYDHEPIRGLPGNLPPGEYIIWQGAPDWRVFARSALFTRWVGGYFVTLVALALVSGSLVGAIGTALAGATGIGLLSLFAVLVARTTVYTLTNRRVVLRIGVALSKCANLPLALIGSASLRERGAGFGDIALSLNGRHRLGYAMLWPHVRPLRFGRPEPMLRALPDATQVARILAEACAAVVPVDVPTAQDRSKHVAIRPVQEAAA